MAEKILKIILILLSIIISYLIFIKVDLIHMGGPLMIPLILISIFAFAIIFGKWKQFFKESIDVEIFLKGIFERVEKQRIKDAIEFCDQTSSPIARMLKAGIMKYDRSKDEIKEVMEDSLLYEIPVLEEGLAILSTIIQIAPLLGLLGTLGGVMRVLLAIQTKSVASMPVVAKDLIPGIWQAVICSTAGFLVVIPALIAYNYLTSRIKTLVDEMERASTELLNFLLERRMSP